MRVEEFLEASAERHPDKTALVAGDARLSYAQLEAAANRLAHGFRANGFGRGERALVFLENGVEAAVTVFAVLKAGGVFSLVNPGTKEHKLAYLIEKYRAGALVTERRLLPVCTAALERSPVPLAVVAGASQLPAGFTAYEQLLANGPASPPADRGIDIDLAMIVTTSGSTGLPKGVMMTHQNIVAAASSIVSYLENVAEDRVLSVLPLAFDYGLYQLLMCAKLGATLILERSFAYPTLVLHRLRQERVTGFPIVPTMAAMLLQRKDLDPGVFASVRYVTSTGASLPPAHIERLRRLFPAARIYSMYGLTECKRCTYLPPEQLERRPDSVGVAIPGTEAYVVDERGQRAAAGVVGELVIRGAHVFKGYWDDEEETRRALRPGHYPWENLLFTGDLFRCDAEGFLYFVGRRDDMIKICGQKVSPKEVENALYALPGVRQAIVVGVPDPVVGTALRAVVAADPEAALTEHDVIAHCAMHLEGFMVPSSVEFRDELPLTATGKLRRAGLLPDAAGSPATVPLGAIA